MTSFLELAQLNTLSKPEWTYDIAFIGSPIDDRGRLSVTKAKEVAQRTAVVSYDAETFTLSVNDVGFAANNRGFRNLISDYPASRILLDASTLEFPEMLLLIKAFLSTEPLELGFLYVEPESYEERRGPETEDLHAFALREEYCVFHLKSAKHSDRNTAIYNDALPATDFDAKTATYSEQNPPARRVSKRGIGVRIRPRRVGVSPAASASTLPSTRSADYR